MRRRLLLSLFFTLIASSLWAYDVVIDGIYYNVIEKAKTAEVTYGETKYTGEIIIPSSIEYGGKILEVNKIGENAFSECPKVTQIIMPNSITTIGAKAFFRCLGLKSISIPSSVSFIGDDAFWDYYDAIFSVNYDLGQVNFADIESFFNIQYGNEYSCPLRIAHHLYIDGKEVTEMEIPEGITIIERCKFDGCKSLTKVSIPNTVNKIDFAAFRGCTNLIDIKIPNSVDSISPCAFQSCI